ncbi:ribosome biogenesis GTPase RsgA [Desulfurobacterium thermolithotrophum DSM 11699]|uniref:Small ribosomal subunit biogenesis GTPase RsgA n=1 Tax=Desulfurobacterium thermolithotrophum (strain DSM 11699 / BSA) TaxID=868864 RepID=F0S243_DESTD|nr:ribosome small subunit-dependent GTPase A [Desulfurobacterium thermolithotrophum]ADY72986.1 ribosome biogenesis GTPase RsgA [Desulfurobacterium thermolithotrophum DSM 11699]
MVEGIVIERAGQKITVFVPEKNKSYRGIPLGKVKKKDKVYAGDKVKGRIVDSESFAIEVIEERKNLLIRPPIANVEKVVIVATIQNPPFQSFLMDNLLVVYSYLGLDTVIVFNKIDLLDEVGKEELQRWYTIYKNAGYKVIKTSAETKEGIEELRRELLGAISIFAGPSGVGKSSLISKLTGKELRIGEVSRKTERGKHTTREVRLIPFEGSFIGDAPGFSRVEALNFMEKEEVRFYFPEFLRYQCKYSDCLHLNEEGCEVREALKKGEISCERYKNYLKMTKEFVPWLKEVCD